MASVIAGGLGKAQQAVQKTASKDKKYVELANDTTEVTKDQGLTTDHGVKVSNTDQWLRPANEEHTGPSLLEDQIAREKVCAEQFAA